MKTAEEFYEYCRDNNYGRGFSRSRSIKHFRIIEETLSSDEEVLMCFIGLYDFHGALTHKYNFAYAVTNRRIILAQKKPIGKNLQTIALDNVNDITYSSGLMFATITIDTIKERFNVGVNTSVGASINERIHDILLDAKNGEIKRSNVEIKQPATFAETTEELMKLKSLLDSGALTQEEFDRQKRILFGF